MNKQRIIEEENNNKKEEEKDNYEEEELIEVLDLIIKIQLIEKIFITFNKTS